MRPPTAGSGQAVTSDGSQLLLEACNDGLDGLIRRKVMAG